MSYYEKDKEIRGQVVYEKCNEINSENWKKAIAEFKPNGALKMHSIMHVENDMSERNHNVPFGEEVT